jgi:hypothetical protein
VLIGKEHDDDSSVLIRIVGLISDGIYVPDGDHVETIREKTFTKRRTSCVSERNGYQKGRTMIL